MRCRLVAVGIASVALGFISVVWMLSTLVVTFAIHAAVTNTWGGEWPNADSDAVNFAVLWVLAGAVIVISWRVLRARFRGLDRRTRSDEHAQLP